MTEQDKLALLNTLVAKFVEFKTYFIGLGLASDNVRLAIERFDDGFLRAREAIFSIPSEDKPAGEIQHPTEAIATMQACAETAQDDGA